MASLPTQTLRNGGLSGGFQVEVTCDDDKVMRYECTDDN
jgi:hypothetical protein